MNRSGFETSDGGFESSFVIVLNERLGGGEEVRGEYRNVG